MNDLLPPTQQAWRIVRRGTPAHALVLEDIPIPNKIPAGEVLVKIQAAALNPVYVLLLPSSLSSNHGPSWFKLMKWLPNSFIKRISESDLAGEVVDPNGSEFQIGDQVFGFIDVGHAFKTRQGSMTSYAFVPANNLVHRPSNISPVEAAGLTLAGLTAYQGIFDFSQLEPGQTIFINGGSTAVGAFAIQFAKVKGCRVVASASGKNEKFVRDLGADEVILNTLIS